MRVRALKSFVGKGSDGVKYRAAKGDILEIPDAKAWIDSGLVAPVDDEPETMARPTAETAAKPKGRKRG